MNRSPHNCRPEVLTLYHYGELEEHERLRLEDHLQQCETCRLELSALRTDLESLPKLEPGFTPESIRDFNERVCRKVRPRFRLPLGIPLGWSVAGAAALLMVMTLLTPGTKTDQTTQVAMQPGGEIERMPDPEMLLNMDLLENLDLLQELEMTGVRG